LFFAGKRQVMASRRRGVVNRDNRRAHTAGVDLTTSTPASRGIWYLFTPNRLADTRLEVHPSHAARSLRLANDSFVHLYKECKSASPKPATLLSTAL